MKCSWRNVTFAVLAAALSLSVVACHGASPSGSSYVPAANSSVSQGADTSAASPDSVGRISSTCGRRIRVIIAGIVDCHFHERGYGNGKFTIHDHTQGIVIINPLSGTRHTRFTVTGAVVGAGYFIVRDTHGHYLVVRVRVRV